MPDNECASCGEGDPPDECPKSERPCGHHCNHIWSDNSCCWCGLEEGGEEPAEPIHSVEEGERTGRRVEKIGRFYMETTGA